MTTPRIVKMAAVLLAVGMSVVGCATASGGTARPSESPCSDSSASCEAAPLVDSCDSYASALTAAATGVVNAFAVVERDPQAFLAQLDVVRTGFENSRAGWVPEVESAAETFVTDLDDLAAAGEAATKGGEIDKKALQEAATDFEEDATGALQVCTDAIPGE